IADLIFLLRIFQGVLAVEKLEQEVFVVLETIVAQADGIFDDVESASLVFLSLDRQIAAQPDTQLLASFEIFGGNCGFHRVSPRDSFYQPAAPARDSLA